MGGRGTFAAGNSVAYSYETVDQIDGIKVLQGIDGKHGLPESAHSSEAYIKLKPDGTFHEIRFYDRNHCLYLEIGYHIENKLGKGNVLHYHTYDSSFSKTRSGKGGRSEAIKATKAMKKQFGKYLKGVNL